jgi:AcrR family transcriptional regulator
MFSRWQPPVGRRAGEEREKAEVASTPNPARKTRVHPKVSTGEEAISEGLRERNKREKLTRIKRAARQLFEKQGFEATTARQICQRANIGTGTLFLYARDKRDLLFLVFEEEARRLFEEGSERAARSSSLVDGLMLLFDGFIDFYAQNPELSKVILQELMFQPHDEGGMGGLTVEYQVAVAAQVERAQQRGEVDSSVAPVAAATACFAHYTLWLGSWLGVRMITREEARKGLRQALELQMQGLAPKPARKRPKQPARPKRPAKKGAKARRTKTRKKS